MRLVLFNIILVVNKFHEKTKNQQCIIWSLSLPVASSSFVHSEVIHLQNRSHKYHYIFKKFRLFPKRGEYCSF